MDDVLMARLAEIEERTRRLEEKEQARNLLHRYAAALDDPVPESIASLFAADAVLRTTAGVHRGRSEITAFFRAARVADTSEKRHFVTSPDVVWLSPGRVQVSSYFLYTAITSGDAVLGWGTYEDVITVGTDAAEFESKIIEVRCRGELGAGWNLPETKVST